MALFFVSIMKKEYRVRKNEEFNAIIAKRRSVASGRFVIYSRKKELEHCRVGISVSKKLGNAVERNKIKRQVRMMIQETVDFENCPKDLIVIIRPKYKENAYLDNRNDLEKLIKKAII